MIAYEKMNRRILHITFYSDINSVLFPRKSTGFTLVEIVVLLLVAAIILPALILPFSEGTRKLELPVIMNTLSFLAQEEMEKNIICLDYDTVASWPSTAITGFPGYTSECAIDGTATFGEVIEGVKLITVTVTYSYPELDPDPSLQLVTVKTKWF